MELIDWVGCQGVAIATVVDKYTSWLGEYDS